MTVYRLSKQYYINDLSGRGAQLTGGRWNSKGVPILYTAESRALAAIEVAVHTPLGIIPADYYLASIELPDDVIITKVDINELPSNWNKNPFVKFTQRIGDEFIRNNKGLILQVPSATVKGDFNYLINPGNAYFNSVKIKSVEPFEFDVRLFKL